MTYSKQFGLKDLFDNPQLEGIIPQVGKTSTFKAKDIDKFVADYIQGALKGRRTDENEITVKGSRKTVLSRVRQLQPNLETLFANMDFVVENMQSSTKLYIPCAGMNALKRIKSFEEKAELLKAIVENIIYNPDFSKNAAIKSALYLRSQEAWKKKVGYKE